MASTQVVAEVPVKEVTNDKAEVVEEKVATVPTEEAEVVVHGDDDDEEEEEDKEVKPEEEEAGQNELDEEEKLEEYSPIIGEDEPNTTFDDEVDAEEGDLI